MHGFNRPLGPIGSNVVAPLQTTSSGMMVTANKIVPGQEAIDFKGYFKVETFPHNSVIYRPGDTTDRVYLLKTRPRAPDARWARTAPARWCPSCARATCSASCSAPRAPPIEEMAVAAGEAEVWSIEGRDFRAQLEARPALALDVVRAYAERVRAPAQARAGPDLQGGPGPAGGHPAHPGRGPRRALPARRRDRPARHHPAGPGGPGRAPRARSSPRSSTR